MAVEVKLPRLGQGMEAGTIVRWLKSEGEPVSKGEPLYELDTDKVTQEVEAEADGVLLKIVLPEGEADVGTTVAVIGSEGEDVSELVASSGGNGGAPAPAAAAQAEQAAEEPRVEPVAAPAEAPPREPGERVKASPLARRIARERGIDLASLTGTGPEGRIIAEDVEKADAAQRSSSDSPDSGGRRGRDRRAHLDPPNDRAEAHRGLGGARLPAHRHGRLHRARRHPRADGRAPARGRDEADGQRRAHARSSPPRSSAIAP